MPRKPETDPAKLEARRRRKRQQHSAYMRRYRQRLTQVGKRLTGLLESAAAGRPFQPPADPDSAVGLNQRAASAVLRLTLERHNLTVDRISAKVSEALEAERLQVIGGIPHSQPNYDARLRAAEHATRLLERSGGLPVDRRPAPGAVHVQVLVIGEDGAQPQAVQIEAERGQDGE